MTTPITPLTYDSAVHNCGYNHPEPSNVNMTLPCPDCGSHGMWRVTYRSTNGATSPAAVPGSPPRPREDQAAEVATLRAELAAAHDALADFIKAYELKLADFARETEHVEILAERLTARGCSPDAWFAEEGHGRSCQDCIALRKALRPAPPQAAPTGEDRDAAAR